MMDWALTRSQWTKMSSSSPINPKVKEALDLLQLAADRRVYRAKDFIALYPKQAEFCNMSLFKRERLFMAGNQVGKSTVGAYEVACHLTGEYPPDWFGRTYDRPVQFWAGGVTSETTREIIQAKLCGDPSNEQAFGTGMIPRDAFVGKPSSARGIADLFDTISVKHKTGGVSTLALKSYEQGRKKWQGKTLDGVWFDEEPPADIYSEGIARLRGDGIAFMTFTPLEGMSDVVLSFIENDALGNCKIKTGEANKGLVMMSLDECTHFTEAEKAARVAGYPSHEREARRRGVPMLGSGRVFQVPEDMIAEIGVEFVQTPPAWCWLWAIDFGIDHPFAAVLLAWNRDTDCIHVVHTIRMSNATVAQHVAAMKAFGNGFGALIDVSWPHDGDKRDARDLEHMSAIYKKAGLHMRPVRAQFKDGSISTESGILEMDERMKTNRFKVARHLGDWWEEFRLYHRKDGLIVKVRDDLLSANRIGIMDIRHARPIDFTRRAGRGQVQMAIGVDDPPW